MQRIAHNLYKEKHMILGIDVSRWQPTVNWELLKTNEVEFTINKATQGNYRVDNLLKTHFNNAKKAGLITGFYHWSDPLISAEQQAYYCLNAIKGYDYDFLALDVEQHWADWAQWSKGNITNFLSPQKISDCARSIIKVWESKQDKPVVIYTRASFVNSYAAPMQAWLPQYPLWLAYYPYSRGRVNTSWETFKTVYKPSIQSPLLPKKCTEWKFWQFTGDKFVLPGVTTALDVNYFNGTLKDMRVWLGMENAEVPPVDPGNSSSTGSSSTEVDPSQTGNAPLSIEERLKRLEEAAVKNGWIL